MNEPAKKAMNAPHDSHYKIYLIENVLVDQKDRILRLIDNGYDRESLAALETVADLWRVADYGHKLREVCERMQEAFPGTVCSSAIKLMISCLDYTEAAGR